MQLFGKNEAIVKLLASAALLSISATVARAADLDVAPSSIIDEARFGVSGSIQSSNTFESGAFPFVTLFFDPFDSANAKSWQDIALRPRVHAGAIVSTDGNASQVYGGFTWTIDVTDRMFVDLGFGGAWNNANTSNSVAGINVGCHVLFHESLSAGYKVTKNWRVLATVEHSSNADLCDSNDGLSYAGLGVGYKF
jgi:lipid A 3-O-deacylase